MTDSEKRKCRAIIHSHAVMAGAGNLLPIPGTGLAADTITMTTMAMALASVFGGSITESVAKTMAINAIISTLKKNTVKTFVKEITKVVPLLGQMVSPAISVAMLESAGWSLANQLDEERTKKLLNGEGQVLISTPDEYIKLKGD